MIIDAVRTLIGKGKPGGALSVIHPVDLHMHAIRALIDRVSIDPKLIDDVISGAVGQIGEQSLNTVRSAVLAAGPPKSVPAATIDRQCGSSQQAIPFAAQGVVGGAYDAVIASGIESMTSRETARRRRSASSIASSKPSKASQRSRPVLRQPRTTAASPA